MNTEVPGLTLPMPKSRFTPWRLPPDSKLFQFLNAVDSYILLSFFFLLREISNMQTLKEYCEKPHILSLLSHVWSCFISLPPPPRFFQRKSKSLDYFICKQVTVTINKESCFEQNHIPLSP